MKLSKVLHVLSVIVGCAAVVTALAGVSAGASNLVWGLTREHLLFCSGLLVLFAIWLTLSSMQHMKLEESGRII